MYIPGTLILFETVDTGENELTRFFLKFVENNACELKMEGGLPRLWRVKRGEVIGPEIGDGEIRYHIVKVDKKRKTVWIIPSSKDGFSKRHIVSEK